MFKKSSNKTKIFIRSEGVIVKEHPVRLVKLLHNNWEVKISSIDRVVNFNLELPIPKPINLLTKNTLYYNCEPTSVNKHDIIMEYPNINKNYVSINNEKFFFDSIVFSIQELLEENGWITLTVSFKTEMNESFSSHMNLYVIVENVDSQNKAKFLRNITMGNIKQQSIDKDIKPITNLSLSDFSKYPIWEWALAEESNFSIDETWIKPSIHKEFNKELNGSLVKGEIEIESGSKIHCVIEVILSNQYIEARNIILYLIGANEYECMELTDYIKEDKLPIIIRTTLLLEGGHRTFEKKILNRRELKHPIKFILN